MAWAATGIVKNNISQLTPDGIEQRRKFSNKSWRRHIDARPNKIIHHHHRTNTNSLRKKRCLHPNNAYTAAYIHNKIQKILFLFFTSPACPVKRQAMMSDGCMFNRRDSVLFWHLISFYNDACCSLKVCSKISATKPTQHICTAFHN